MSRRLDNLDLDNMEGMAKTQRFSHPSDVIRLVEEIRILKAELERAKKKTDRGGP